MSDEMKKVMERVRKMLRIANDAAATEGERDNALRMAHATLAKHNLSLSEAERDGAAPEEAREKGTFVGRDYPWMRTTVYAVAGLFFCEYVYCLLRSGKVAHYFVGRASNIATAQEMSQFVISSIDREATRWSRENGTGGTGWRSFCKGAAYRVAERCAEIRRSAEKAPAPVASTGTALVLASVYAAEKAANEALMAQMFGKLREGRNRQRNTDAYAHAAGREYGDRVSLNTQISSSSGRKQLT